MSKKNKLILMRHGQSFWNQRNIFTGWVDVPLTETGVKEAIDGGKKIQDIPIDVIFTSTLIRAQMTAFLAMMLHHSKKVPVMIHTEKKLKEWGVSYGEKANQETIAVHTSWHLNERMYGKLQGLNKDDTRAKYGKDQVHIWRRSYSIAPPDGESLQETAKRTLPYFKSEIVPCLNEGKNVFISAHGNSLRSIIMYLENLNDEEVVKLEIATGDPLIYEYSLKGFKKVL